MMGKMGKMGKMEERWEKGKQSRLWCRVLLAVADANDYSNENTLRESNNRFAASLFDSTKRLFDSE